MGQSRTRRNQFFADHPLCIFCGGSRPAETLEHCPPRAMFQNRAWPEGFEFAACKICNSGSSDDDLIVTFLARMAPDNSGDLDGKVAGLIRATQRQLPGLLEGMFPSPAEAKRINKSIGISPPAGLTHQETGVAKVLPRMEQAVATLTSKLSRAIYYMYSGRIFPSNGDIAFTWFTSADLITHGHYPVLKAMENIAGVAPSLTRNKSVLNDQFQYKWTLSEDYEVFALQAVFSHSFGIAAFGSVQADLVAAKIRELDAARGSAGRFIVLANHA